LFDGDIAGALGDLRRVIDARPDWAEAHFLMGSALFLSGDKTGARAEVGRALELDANLLPAQRMMAKIHQSLGDNLLAIEVGRRVLERNPDDTTMRVMIAQSMVTERRFDEALSELEKISVDALGAEEQYAIGRVQLLRGQREPARAHLLAAAALEPNSYEVLRALLDLDMRDGRLEESLERIREAQRALPDDAGLMQLHGEVSLYAGRPDEAESSFRRAIELNPNDLRAYQNLARYLAVTGRPQEVLATYEAALESNTESASLHLIVGSLYELNGRDDGAMERYEAAIRIDPSLAVAKNNLAYLLTEEGGNLDRALDLAQEAKALLPDNPNTADTLGWVLYHKKVPSAAVGYLREAEGGMPPEDPQVAVVRYHLALAYEASGEPDLAREALERAVRDLDRAFGEAGDVEEPPWAKRIRSMHRRLTRPRLVQPPPGFGTP
jgi:tetratricopeptide (TPR) repeat protein